MDIGETSVCDSQMLVLVWQPAAVSDAWLAGQLSASPHQATEAQEAGGGKDELVRWFTSLQRGQQAVRINYFGEWLGAFAFQNERRWTAKTKYHVSLFIT